LVKFSLPLIFYFLLFCVLKPLWNNVRFTCFLLIRELIGRHKARVNFCSLFMSTIRGLSKNYKALFLKYLYFNAIPFKVVPSGSKTFLDADLPSQEALLEFFFCEVLPCAPYNSLYIFYRLEIMLAGSDKWKCKCVLCKDLTIPTSPRGSATHAVIREYQLQFNFRELLNK
jgi:hypothetical protein